MPIRLDQIDTAETQATPGLPSIPNLTGQAPAGMEVQSVTLGGKSPTVRLAPSKVPPKPRPVPSGQMVVLESTNKAISRLQRLIQLQQEKQFKTGPLSPRFYRGNIGNAAMQYLGTPEERVFKAENERFVNDYITAQTGAQRGFKEMTWLQTAIPSPSQDTPENYLVNAQSALEDLIRNRDQMLQMLEETGYKAPKQSSQTPESNITPSGLKYKLIK